MKQMSLMLQQKEKKEEKDKQLTGVKYTQLVE